MVDDGTVSGDEESESSGEEGKMETFEADNTERDNITSFWGVLHQLLRAPEAAYTAGFVFAPKDKGPPARVLLMIRLRRTAFRMVPMSSSLHGAPRK